MVRVLAATLLMLTVAGAAAAQTPPPAASVPVAPPVRSLVSIGDRVSLTTADGVIHEGRILSLTTVALEVQLARSHQKETVAFDRLRRVELAYRDSVSDGLKLGLIAGLIGGIVIGTVSTASECHDRGPDDKCSAGDVFGAMGIASGVGAGAGAVIGAVADAMHLSIREVWRAPARVSAEPMMNVGTRRLGLRLTIRW